jgi:hypothetical protein
MIIVRVKAHQEILNANVSISIYNSDGINVGIAFSWDDSFYLSLPVRGIYHIHFKLKNATLVPGQYFIGVGLNQSDRSKAWDGISYYPVFNIENQNNIEEYAHRSWGVNHFVDNDWSVKKINI